MIKFKINSCDGIYDSLDVRFTKACDNSCEFCIERTGLDSLGKTNVEKMIESTIKSRKRDILILGGEPLLLPELVLEYIKGIRSYVDTIYLTTSLPKTITTAKGNHIFLEIVNLLDGINISVHHYKDSINNMVLNSSNPYNRIEFLEEMLKNDNFAKKARLCCNLVNGFISTKEEINNFVNKMHSIGAKHIKLNELQNVDANTYVSFEETFGVKLKSPFAYGCQTDESYLFDNKIKITLKRSCFCNKDTSIAKAGLADLIKCIQKKVVPNVSCNNLQVLYENGDIHDGWQQSTKSEHLNKNIKEIEHI